MNIIAFETSSSLFSVALKAGSHCLKYEELMTHQQAEKILPVVQGLIDEAGLRLQDLNAIALGQGPGNFTGLRISSSVVQAIAFAFDLPVVLISSLKACAQATFDQLKQAKVLVGFNAYQHEIYWGGYEVDSDGWMREKIPDSLLAPKAVLAPDSDNWLGVGNAWEIYSNELRSRCAPILSEIQINHYPTAAAVIRLAEKEFLKKTTYLPKKRFLFI